MPPGVFIVEDDEQTLTELEFLVSGAGYALSGEAANLIEALAADDDAVSSVVVIGLNEPWDEGSEAVAKLLKDKLAAQVVVLVDAHAPAPAPGAALPTLQPVAVLRKPVAPVDLIAAIEQALAAGPRLH